MYWAHIIIQFSARELCKGEGWEIYILAIDGVLCVSLS